MSVQIVTGLGNPGSDYVRTPHNVGFRVIDRVAERCSAAWRNEGKFSALVARVKWEGRDLLLVKPQTFMNLSGESVGKIMRYYDGTLADLIVISDDADLPVGRLRLRTEGGTGGHRGLQSIIDCCGGKTFARVRVGVGRSVHGGTLADHVLARLAPEEEETMQRAEAVAAEAVLFAVRQGMDKAMNKFNAESAQVAPKAE